MLLLLAGFYIAVLAGAAPPQFPEPRPEQIRTSLETYASGTFAEIFRLRVREWLMLNSFVVFITRILGIFLFGLYIWRQGYLLHAAAHLEWWKRAQRIALPIGLLGNAMAVVAINWMHVNPMRPSLSMLGLFVVQSVSVPALSLFYAATVVLLYHDPAWRRRLHPFASVGRMALTNYLLQSVICTTIFYSYGLGLYGTVGPFLALPLTIAVYGAQIPFSQWWLARHQYGPMEWVWRRMTYGAFPVPGIAAEADQERVVRSPGP
jgi:uncharacterized protein